MKKFYKCLKALPIAKWTAGEDYELEESDALDFIASGHLELLPVDEREELTKSILQKLEANQFASTTAAVKAVIEMLGIDNSDGKGPRIRVIQDEADKTKSFADLCKHVVFAQCPQLCPGKQQEGHERLVKVYGSRLNNWAVKKDLAEGSGTSGGYTVAPDYGQELLKLAFQQAIVRPLAKVKVLPAREAYYPMLNQTFTPTGTIGAPQSAYYGGVQMYWGGEAQPINSTEPNFKQVHVATNQLYGLTKISRTLLSDTFLEMEGELKDLFAGAIAYAEDYAFLVGNGEDMPLGVLSSPAALSVNRATSNLFKLADAAAMMANLMPQSQSNSVWVMTNKLFAQLVQLVDASGRVTYIPNVGTGYNIAQLATGMLLLFGRPVLFTEKLPAVGSTGDALLCDFSKYIVADTGGLEIAASDQYAFNTNQITFRTIKRVDGQPQIDAPFTQQDGTSQISPFVYLNAST